MLTDAAMDAIRTNLMRAIAYARYKAGDTYYQAQIQTAEILPNSAVAVSFLIDTANTGDNAITEVQLYDNVGVLLASRAVNILRTEALEGILYRVYFSITETEAE